MGVLAPARRGIFSQPTAKPFPSTGLTGRLRADSIAQADNSAVATWPGLVGGDATQATSGNRPTYKISGINSKPTVQFSRASAQSLGWAGVSASTDPFSLFVVFQPPASVSGSALQALLGAGAGGLDMYCRLDTGRVFSEKNNAGFLLQSADSFCAASTPVASLISYGSAGPTGTIYRNGSSYTTLNLTSRPFTAGQTTTIGSDSQFPGAEYNGQIAEIAKWDHQLDSTERTQLFAYSLDRYGV
jgi:hypothetical protein